ncbi:putative methyltransferase DDB_G0268948 [Physella acuta]|uniref:putative methyltransferase DDB_G0268948 n=1 Tax=Physella acuta TaxID=109671 RepID=UPI0027DDBDBF|nr:putative methyltransferase DDB_G0268948 [Physella acuta]
MATELHKGKNFANLYATYRPSYPQEIYDQIMAYHLENSLNGRQLAVNVGCGTGISTLPLVNYFDKVIGTDISEDMMAHVPKDIPKLECHVSFAEDLEFLEDRSVDLVTIATALHWVDEKRFFSEVRRILKPGGTLAVYGLGSEALENNKAQSYILQMLNLKIVSEFQKFEMSEIPFKNVRRLVTK